MRGNIGALVALLVLFAVLAVVAYYYQGHPADESDQAVSGSPDVSESDINAQGQQPADLNVPVEENSIDIPAVSAGDVEVELPENI